MSNLFVSDYVGARYDYNSAKNTENRINNISTAAGIAVTGALGYGVTHYITKDPAKARKIYQSTNKYANKGYDKALKYGKKALDYVNKNETVKKTTGKISEWLKKGLDAFSKTDIGKVVANKLDKFSKLSGAKRGKYMLLAVGVAVLGGAIVNMIRQHDRNDGAINQKYKDISTLSRVL